MGYGAEAVHATSGMVIHPDFYLPAPADRGERLRAIGLDPSRPTGLVLFGGQGSTTMQGIARELHDTQLILACGHNRALAERLRALPGGAPRHVLGYTNQIAATMQLADFFIGKAGPGSVSEAVQMGLPVVVTRNAWTLPQERYNTTWVQEQGAGLVIKGFAHVRTAVADLLADLPAAQRRVRQIRNRAVFEVPEILARILDAAQGNLRWQPPQQAVRLGAVTPSPSPGHIDRQ
jgi:UDP-N-acetylglucosamine:LPS N-acetylglucosamine transferase